MKVAAIQLNTADDKIANINRAQVLVKRAIAAKSRFIVLPEVFNYRGPISREILSNLVAEKILGPSTRPFMDLAHRGKVYILLGSLYEKIPQNSKVYNTAVLINPKGKIAAVYRKRHLFDAVIGKTAIRESKIFCAGKKIVTASIDEFQLGMSICYDLRFPEQFRAMSALGCDLLTVPSSFTKKTGEAHWETLLRARAIENLSFVIAPNQIGKDGKGVATYGNSMIIDPWGRVLARGSGTREEILYASIDRKAIDEARQILPSIRSNVRLRRRVR